MDTPNPVRRSLNREGITVSKRSDAQQPRQCLRCGYWFMPTRLSYLHCSRSCGARNTNVIVPCAECGKETSKKPSQVKLRKSLYCGRTCADKGHSKRMLETMGKLDKGNKYYISGRRYEQKVVHQLRAEGYTFAQRSPGSRGTFDVWALRLDENGCHLKLVQVKAMKNTKTVNRAMNRKERTIMLDKVAKNSFSWAGKMRGVPAWAETVDLEIWVYDKGKGLYRNRVKWQPRKDPVIIDVDH